MRKVPQKPDLKRPVYDWDLLESARKKRRYKPMHIDAYKASVLAALHTTSGKKCEMNEFPPGFYTCVGSLKPTAHAFGHKFSQLHPSGLVPQ
jgi:hypothetical protein